MQTNTMRKWIALSKVARPVNRLARFGYGLAAIDQIGLSVFNFALNLCLIKALSALEFGIVSLWMAALLSLVGIQGALVYKPFSVHVPSAPTPIFAAQLESALATVNLFFLVLVIIGIAVLGSVTGADWVPPNVLGISICCFILTGLHREYYRAIAFGRRDMAMLFAIDAPYLAISTGFLSLLLIWPESLARPTAIFFALSMGCLASQICIWGCMRRRVPPVFGADWLKSYRAIFHDVTWLLFGSISAEIQGRSYVYISTSLIGLAGLGAINAVGMLFRPARLLMNSWGSMALPYLAGVISRRQIAEFDRTIVIALVLGTAGSAAVFGLLWLAWEPIERHLLDNKYPNASMLLLPWALASGLNIIEYVLGIALQAAREFRYLTFVTSIGALTTIIATYSMISWFGYSATLYGLATSNAVMIIMEARRLWTVRRKFLKNTLSERGAISEIILRFGGP
jgi:O-antigen/teichoic acid export membrane protein